MKNRTTQISMLAGALLAGVVTLAAPASAAITNNTAVVNLVPSGGGNSTDAGIVAAWGGNPILSGDLATNATITLLSGGYPFGGSVANLKDGLMVSGGGTLDNTDNSATFDNGASPSQIRLVLDGTYDLAKIDVFTSYTWNRSGQKWDVFTSTDGGTNWSGTALASVNYLNEEIEVWQSRRVSVFDDASAAIASGVNALRFDIYDTSTAGGGNDISVYSEIAVYAVPESGTAALALIGLAALAVRLRRRK